MKSKIIYLFIFIFSASFFLTARKNNRVTSKEGTCTWSNKQECCESKKEGSKMGSDSDLTPFGVSFFNI